MIKASDIFTPGTLPVVTYYERPMLGLEQKLQDALDTKGFLCSVSGPSKCGKTVLCEKVVSKEGMILITGASIDTLDKFWGKLRQALQIAKNETNLSSNTSAGEISGTVEGSGGIPLFAKVKAAITGKSSSATTQTKSLNFDDKNSKALFSLLRENNITLIVDDFHYIAPDVQIGLANEFKEAIRENTQIVVISVLHRSDQAIRMNPDLRGRITNIEIPFWDDFELVEIPNRGFAKLLLDVDPEIVNALVKESASSPQLMQTLCLQFCRDYGFRVQQLSMTRVDIGQIDMNGLFKNSSSNSNCLTIYNILRNGPKTRGSDRKLYDFVDKTKGDMYAAILKAIAMGEPTLAFTFTALRQRIDSIIVGGIPKGISILSPLGQMDKSVKSVNNEDRVLEVDEEKQSLTILDPHFLHYLRWAV